MLLKTVVFCSKPESIEYVCIHNNRVSSVKCLWHGVCHATNTRKHEMFARNVHVQYLSWCSDRRRVRLSSLRASDRLLHNIYSWIQRYPLKPTFQCLAILSRIKAFMTALWILQYWLPNILGSTKHEVVTIHTHTWFVEYTTLQHQLCVCLRVSPLPYGVL
jgi:hypothetical protein